MCVKRCVKRQPNNFPMYCSPKYNWKKELWNEEQKIVYYHKIFFFFLHPSRRHKLYKTNEHKWGHLIFKSFSRVKLTNTNTEWPNNYYTLFLNTLIQRVHLIGFACHQFQKCRGKLVKSGGACFQRWGWWRLKRVVEISTRTIVMLIMTFLSIEPFFLS